jgi:hypothetical protein
MPKRKRLAKRSNLLPIDPHIVRDANSLDEAVGPLEADLRRRVQECDENESGWAEHLLLLLSQTRRAIRRRDPELAATYALELGVTIQGFEWAFNFGGDLQRGVKFADGLQRAGAKKGKANRPRNIQMAKEYLAKLPSWAPKSETALMVRIGKSRGLGRSASIDAINEGIKIVRSKAIPNG